MPRKQTQKRGKALRHGKIVKPEPVENVVAIWKRVGETPLEAITRLRQIDKTKFGAATLSYAGRLDPAAEGVLLVLVDDANKNREKYLHLDKTYEIEILFGVSTDTYDLLGIIDKVAAPDDKNFKEKALAARLDFTGKFSQAYPPYSSKTIDGKALFEWARGGAAMMEMPVHDVEIFSIRPEGFSEISGPDAAKRAELVTNLVKGDFRQSAIRESWRRAAAVWGPFPILKLVVSCGSGTYMRVLARDIGAKIGVPALACSIVRTKTGKWGRKDCVA